MFVQVIEAKVADADRLRQQVDKWRSELKPGADGYLGSTSGITPDSQFIAIVRFESEEKANANNDRPEQGTWWSETKSAFDGEATFHNCPEVETLGGGGANDARFVQVLQGKAKDKAAMQELGRTMEDRLKEARPDVIGGLLAWHEGGNDFTQVVYFKSEEEARQREKETEDNDLRQQLMSMFEGQPRFLDLPEPNLD